MNRLAILAAAVSAFMVVGCGQGNFSEKASQNKANVFRYPIVTSPTTLDPGKVQDGDTIDAVQQVFEGLVGWGTDNKVVPILAEKWEISSDGTLYTFTLKDNITFSNGKPITAQVFKDVFERNTNKAFGSPTAETYLSDIVGIKEKVAGKASEVSGIKVVDDKTLTIQIDKPRPYFLGKLTYPITFAVDLSSLDDPSKEMTDVSKMIGSGPYTFESFTPDQILKFKANASYHGGKPAIDGIERPIVKDAATRLNMFKAGELDLVQLERQDLKAVNDDAALKPQLQLFDRPSLWYVGLNQDLYPALKNPKVRQAIAMSIDVDNIVDNVLGGVNKKATSIVPPGVFGHRPEAKGYDYDPEQARKLLAEAGYPDGKGIAPMELYHREARPDIALVATQVSTDLKKNLNISVTPRQMEWRAYLEKHNAKELPFVHMRWGADYLDAENFLSTLLAGYGPENKMNYNNPAYDALTRKGDTTLNEAERLAAYAAAEDIVLKDVVFIPIYFQRDAELISPRVKGLRESLFGHLPHTGVSME